MTNFNREKGIVTSSTDVEKQIDESAQLNADKKIVTSYTDVEKQIDESAQLNAEKKIVTSYTDFEKQINVPAELNADKKRVEVRLFTDVENEIDVSADVEEKPVRWKRILLGTIFVSLGVAAISVGVASISYRLTHIVVNGGVVNGRTVRLNAPGDGNLKAFYAKSGTEVRSGQVLARIKPPVNIREKYQRESLAREAGLQLVQAKDKQIRQKLAQERLAGQVKLNEAELIAARESLDFLRNQLKNVENQSQAMQAVDVQLATQVVKQKEAAVELAQAKAAAARSDYQRFQKLLADGAISQQKVDNLRFTFEAADAELKEVQAASRGAKTVLDSVKRGVVLNSQQKGVDNFAQQRSKLQQAIQNQQMIVNTLETKVSTSRLQLNQNLALLRNRLSIAKIPRTIQSSPQLQEIKAPFNGVVYTTNSEQGEQVSSSQPILTLLNCNDLWVETLVEVDDASRIDVQKPVKIKLSTTNQTFDGEIDIIQPLDNTRNVDQPQKGFEVKALSPMIPMDLVGKRLMRVKVTIPQTNLYTQSQRFCGIGQIAQLTFSQK
ncbi:MAG: HlyD family efflux transporter periplasmic adaptor subunit [Rivularia sp. (in: cyanobacteria)]